MMVYLVKLLFFLIGMSACHGSVYLRVYNESSEDYKVVVPLEQAEDILPYLNASRPTIFYVFGIKGDATVISVRTVITAFIKCGAFNMVLVDWSKEAKNLLVIVPLSYIAYNVPGAEEVGFRLGNAIVILVKKGLVLSSIILMGHSMGAQIAGTAGRTCKLQGIILPRIVGLDPAGPGFTTVIPLLPTLDTSCATIVIIIHTDPNGLGSGVAKGHIDFFPNYNKTYTMQPGCTQKSNPLVLNNETTCSHDYSWRLIAASVCYSNLLLGEFATDGDAWRDGRGDPTIISTIRIDLQLAHTGSFFLTTNEAYPYGRGEDGINPP